MRATGPTRVLTIDTLPMESLHTIGLQNVADLGLEHKEIQAVAVGALAADRGRADLINTVDAVHGRARLADAGCALSLGNFGKTFYSSEIVGKFDAAIGAGAPLAAERINGASLSAVGVAARCRTPSESGIFLLSFLNKFWLPFFTSDAHGREERPPPLPPDQVLAEDLFLRAHFVMGYGGHTNPLPSDATPYALGVSYSGSVHWTSLLHLLSTTVKVSTENVLEQKAMFGRKQGFSRWNDK